MIALWLIGLVRRRPVVLAGPIVGVTVAVALLASLGMFLAASKATMTARATSPGKANCEISRLLSPLDADTSSANTSK